MMPGSFVPHGAESPALLRGEPHSRPQSVRAAPEVSDHRGHGRRGVLCHGGE